MASAIKGGARRLKEIANQKAGKYDVLDSGKTKEAEKSKKDKKVAVKKKKTVTLK
jgi:hypothetical protein